MKLLRNQALDPIAAPSAAPDELFVSFSRRFDMNILIAEDNALIQEVIGTLMERWGFKYDIASNGKEAVEFAKENEGKYDLCLMDTDMPIMDGLEATKMIRRNVKYFPILSLSGDYTNERKCLESGADEFLAKPYSPGELYKKMDGWNGKVIQVHINEDIFNIEREMPMGPKQASILKELKEKGLSLINIFGTAAEASFIVNESVPNYIEEEFAKNQKQSVAFLDHNPENKGLCRLFAKTAMVVKTLMLDEDFEYENDQEKTRLKKIVTANDPDNKS